MPGARAITSATCPMRFALPTPTFPISRAAGENSSSQHVQHGADLIQKLFTRGDVSVAEPLGLYQVGLELVAGRFGDCVKAGLVARRQASEPFCNIPGNCRRSGPHLVGETESLLCGEGFRQLVDL